MLSKKLINRKISLIQEDLGYLLNFSKYTFEEVAKDYMKKATMERLLERIINRAIDINEHIIANIEKFDTNPPKDYHETFMILAELKIYSEKFAKEISKSIGTRNKLAHEYEAIDHELIYKSVKDCLRDYSRYNEFIIKFLKKFKD